MYDVQDSETDIVTPCLNVYIYINNPSNPSKTSQDTDSHNGITRPASMLPSVSQSYGLPFEYSSDFIYIFRGNIPLFILRSQTSPGLVTTPNYLSVGHEAGQKVSFNKVEDV